MHCSNVNFPIPDWSLIKMRKCFGTYPQNLRKQAATRAEQVLREQAASKGKTEFETQVHRRPAVQCIRANNGNLELERLICYLVNTQKLGKFCEFTWSNKLQCHTIICHITANPKQGKEFYFLLESRAKSQMKCLKDRSCHLIVACWWNLGGTMW